MAIIRDGAALSPALGFEVLEVQPEAWLGTCTSILSIRMPGPPSFSGFLSSYLLTIAFLYLSPWQCHRPGVHGPAGGRGGKGQGQEAVRVHVPLLGSETPTGEGGAPIQAGSEEGLMAVPLDSSEKEPGALEQQVEGTFGGSRISLDPCRVLSYQHWLLGPWKQLDKLRVMVKTCNLSEDSISDGASQHML